MTASVARKILSRVSFKSRRTANDIRERFKPVYYWINRENVIWPLAEIYVGNHLIVHKLIAVTGPIRSDREAEAVKKYLELGYRLIGISSYQEFPGTLSNPHEYKRVYEFSFFASYRDACIGWLHCFRNPDICLPSDLPRIFIAESDFTDPARIRPGRVDNISLPTEKSYDFVYVCGPGPWNSHCRNLPLAERCISLLAENGFRVLFVGREETPQWAQTSNVFVKPYLRWYEFLEHLSQCRYLLVPNIHDASPRILADALCLDIPILVNQDILGGWHYVNRSTGLFFSDEHDLLHRVEALLRGTFEPRKHFVQHYGPIRSGRVLRKFLLKIARQNEVPSLPKEKGESTSVDYQTLEVCRKIRVGKCSAPPRVAFLIYTYAPNHRTRCRAQYITWGKRAQEIIYFSNTADKLIPVVCLDFEGSESYSNMCRKTAAMLRYAWVRLSNEYDWFMVGGDDLYVILDNLYSYLSSEEIREAGAAARPMYLGRRFKRPRDDFTYNSGGAGYVLNKAALEAFIESRSVYEDQDGFSEDSMVGMVLREAGIEPFDTRDPAGAERFHPFTPRIHFDYRRRNAAKDDWFAAYTREFDLIEGIDGISPDSISFHYVDEHLMHALDRLLRAKESESPA